MRDRYASWCAPGNFRDNATGAECGQGMADRRGKRLGYAVAPLLLGLALALGWAAEPFAQEAAEALPDGLVCPEEIAGGERISVSRASAEPGVTGYCIYYLLGETDLESVTMTLRTANADYDWQRDFKAPKIEKGGMTAADLAADLFEIEVADVRHRVVPTAKSPLAHGAIRG